MWRAIAAATYILGACVLGGSSEKFIAASPTGNAVAAGVESIKPSSAPALDSSELPCSSRSETLSGAAPAVPFTGLSGTANERSFVVSKARCSWVWNIANAYRRTGSARCL